VRPDDDSGSDGRGRLCGLERFSGSCTENSLPECDGWLAPPRLSIISYQWLCCINKLKLLKEKKLFDFQNPTIFNNHIGCNIYLICATKPLITDN
jgi:hypothetical protein